MTTTLFINMLNKYNALSYTHNYIFGFTYKGAVYAVRTTADVLPYIIKLDKASRGAGYSLRFRPTKAQKLYLIGLGAQCICSIDYFNSEVKNSRYNKGEIFERMITHMAGQKWHKDSVPFNIGADLTAYGIDYQIKFENATFTNEKILGRL